MAMTVSGVNPAISTYNGINSIAQRRIQHIATGSNYPNAAAGASEYAISARLASNTDATSQSIQNTQNISSAIKISAGATNNTIDALTAIRENVIKAADDTNGSLDRQAIQKNVNQIISQIDANAYVQYNGMNMLDGSRNALVLAGIDGYENFQAGDLRAEALGLTDDQGNVKIDVSTSESAKKSLIFVDAAATRAGNILDSMHILGDYVIDGVSVDSILQEISADGNLFDEATTQGAQLQRLEFQEANYRTMEENQIAASSIGDDADIAKQATKLHSEQLQQQFALFGMKMFNQNRASISQLLP